MKGLRIAVFGCALALLLAACSSQPVHSSRPEQAGRSQVALESNESFSQKGSVESHTFEALRKAAEQGDPQAQSALGACYDEGKGVRRNYVEAAKWFRKAAEQNDANAQFNLGVYYASGNGVRRDEIEAIKWYRKAADQNEPRAQNNLAVLDERLTKEQVAEGQARAYESKPGVVSSENSGGAKNDLSEALRIKSQGTAFFITADGYLLTSEHVIGEATTVGIMTGNGFLRVKVIKTDKTCDVALLKAEGDFLPLPLSPSSSARLGQTVATVGFPNTTLQGLAPKFSKGEIAALTGIMDDARYFQISLPVQPGNSGGALVDERGNVIGVVAAKLSARAALVASGTLPENVNYAVKSGFLLSFLESVPEVAAKLKVPNTARQSIEDVVALVQRSSVLVLVY